MQAVIYPALLPPPGAETRTSRGDETRGLKDPESRQDENYRELVRRQTLSKPVKQFEPVC